MAEPLKHLFNENVVRAMARDLKCAQASFPDKQFIAACLKGLEELGLTARSLHIAQALKAHLPPTFSAAVKVLLDSLVLDAKASTDKGDMVLSGLHYLPYTHFVQHHGLDDCATALAAQYAITPHCSAEFSIRAFLEKYPEQTYAQLLTWTGDANPHVRRLASEGSRPRLPWAPRLREFQKDPTPVIELLERLKDDPERYVQRSVANNLNDIGKDHPELVVALCRHWAKGAPTGRKWIIKHALRSLIKQGHRGALKAMGAAGKPQVSIDQVKLSSKRIAIGEKLQVSLRLTSTAKKSTKKPQQLLVDYAVHFVKANGATRPKVFKLRKLALAAGESITLTTSVSFKPMTTRRPYPGRHGIDLLINGLAYPLCQFTVTASGRRQ